MYLSNILVISCDVAKKTGLAAAALLAIGARNGRFPTLSEACGDIPMSRREYEQAISALIHHKIVDDDLGFSVILCGDGHGTGSNSLVDLFSSPEWKAEAKRFVARMAAKGISLPVAKCFKKNGDTDSDIVDIGSIDEALAVSAVIESNKNEWSRIYLKSPKRTVGIGDLRRNATFRDRSVK